MSSISPHTVLEDQRDEYENFLRTYYRDEIAELHQHWPNEQQSLAIDWSDIARWDSDVADDVRDHPELFKVVFEHVLPDIDMPSGMDIEGAEVRFTNTLDPIQVSALRGDHAGSLIGVKGQITKTTGIMPRLTVANLRCKSCGGNFDVAQPKAGIEEPAQCKIQSCKGKRFEVDFDKSEWEHHQLARLKEPPEEGDGEEYIDVHLTGDAVGSVQAGDRADVFGILETDFDGFETTIPDFYLDGHAVKKHESDYEDIDIRDEREQFEAIANGEKGDPYELLIDSIAPSIRGGEKIDDIKLAVGLQLFGGWRRSYGDGRYARGDSHIALIGDPGTGKSSLLEAAEEISPRSAYTSGKNASTAGLTAAAVRDDFGDTEWSLEAGVIVKAHKGMACVDEIDKVDPDAISSLHTALEKQQLEVNKAGIDASLKCQTALLAAGNPKEGRFIDELGTNDQLNLPPALMSRFDLIFTMRDKPEEDQDRRMASHIARTRQLSGMVARGDINSDDAEMIDPAIPKSTLRAHIAYARQNCYPVIEDDSVIEMVEDYFTNIRNNTDSDSVPITARKLDGILRLAESSARVRLSDEVTKEDVQRAIDIVGRSLGDIGFNEDGDLDADIVETGTSTTQRKRVQRIKSALTDADEPLSVKEIAAATNLEESTVENRIEIMWEEGRVTQPDPGYYRGV